MLENKPVFSRLALGGEEEIRSLRLVTSSGSAQLFVLSQNKNYENLLSVTSLDTRTSRHSLPALQSSFGVPQWDVFTAGSSHAALAWTMPGSASCSLQYRAANGSEIQLSRLYPGGVFMNPRFVRGDVRTPAVTAVRSGGDTRSVVLFSSEAEPGAGGCHTLPAVPGLLLEQQLLLRSGEGFYLLVKVRSGPATADRQDGTRTTVRAGQLYLLHLAGDLKTAAPVTQPFGDTPIYEFDADAAGSHVCLMATTATGVHIAVGNHVRGALEWASFQEFKEASALLSPTLVMMGGAVYAAALAGLDTPDAHVLVTHLRTAAS